MRSAIIASACAAICAFAFASASANEAADESAPAVTTAAAVAPSAAPSPDPLGDLIETLPDTYSEWPYTDRVPRSAEKPAPQRVVVPPPRPPGDLWVRIRRGFRIPDLDTK